jgi:hypothetical protein
MSIRACLFKALHNTIARSSINFDCAIILTITYERNPTFPKSRVSGSSNGDRFGLHRPIWVHKLADSIGINSKENTPEISDRAI